MGFWVIVIERDAFDRADQSALRLIKMADTLCAAVRVDFIDDLAPVNGLIRAFGFTNIAVDTGLRDD